MWLELETTNVVLFFIHSKPDKAKAEATVSNLIVGFAAKIIYAVFVFSLSK
jgi:hypothetical protein